MSPVISLQNVTAGYEHKPILYDVSLNVYASDFLGIVGPNGGGKTTLIKVILGQIKPMNGTVCLFHEGKRVDKLNVGYLPQNNMIDKKFPISVYEVIRSGLSRRKLIDRRLTTKERERIDEVINRVELNGYGNKAIGELSGGQLQRVLLGRAIVSQPEIVILDEPNTFVDKRFEKELYDIIAEINKNCTIIMVSHQLDYILKHAKNIAVVNGHLFYHPNNEANADWVKKIFE